MLSNEIPRSAELDDGLRPLGLRDPPLHPASVVNTTTSTTPTMEDSLIGGVGHLQVLDPLGSAPS